MVLADLNSEGAVKHAGVRKGDSDGPQTVMGML